MPEIEKKSPQSAALFKAAPANVQMIIKQVLTKEREVRHQKKRDNIFADILKIIRENSQ